MPIFTTHQLERFSNTFDNAGQVSLGSLIISPIISSADQSEVVRAVFVGAMLTIFLWWVSLRLERISS